MPKAVTYLVERRKIQCVIFFYSGIAVMLFSLISGLQPSIPGKSSLVSAMPYTVAHPYDAAQAAAMQASIVSSPGASIWPIHGKVTTEFGASDYPYQSSHTGIDISTGKPSGATPVAVFRSGTVVAVIHSSRSYGNHVIIDHGNGLTSLYGHLYSISAFQGQQVRTGDIIGTEGSTGDSTGTHLHFEIRQDNIPQSPRHYEMGNP